jgi:hypothetical protein
MPAVLLLLPWPVSAQIKTGELSSSLSGTIAPGYTADYGNQTSSDHSWTIGGVANYSGSFYSPNFLSFNASVYLNQSRANSNFQSISNASGVNATANIFGGSRFPGSVSYSKAYNSEGNYDVPGIANYVTHGNNDTFGVNWSENLPNAPSFSAGFQMGHSAYSVYGSDNQGNNAFHALNLHSSYRYAGFNMGTYFTTGASHSLIPEVVSGETNTETHSNDTAYGFNASHMLPLHGSASASINRSSYNTNYLGTSSTGTVDIISTMVSVHPLSKVSITGNVNYSDNLTGELVQSAQSSGILIPGIDTNEGSNSLDLMAVASYVPITSIQTSAYVERRSQSFLGQNYGVDSLGASATYSHALFDGNFSAALNLTENTADQTGDSTLGFSTTENYSNEVLGWKVNGSFGYSQNVQTLLITYMNSFFNYSGTARRRWGKLNFSAGAGASRTALTEEAGTANTSESFSSSVGYGQWLTATGSYSKASGQALETGTGLVPIPSSTSSSSLVSLFGGSGYTMGLSSSPVRNLIITGSYARSKSDTTSSSITSLNENNEFSTLIQYQVRKLSFNSGFSRLGQGFSGTGSPAQVISSFYVGVSRWFNFF